jgi:hypothetical protein
VPWGERWWLVCSRRATSLPRGRRAGAPPRVALLLIGWLPREPADIRLLDKPSCRPCSANRTFVRLEETPGGGGDTSMKMELTPGALH